jgi:hypothetical protein
MSRTLLIVRRWLVTAAGILVAMTVTSYVVGVNSGAMAAAEDTLRHSDAVRQRVGEVRTIRLQLWGFSLNSEFSGDRAELDLVVKGSTGAVDVTMKMKELDGRWIVGGASIPL